MDPTREEWRDLYAAVTEFRSAAPWSWMSDGDLFGVQDPESEQVGYCCIMGQAGEHYGLGLYMGSEGLAAIWAMQDLSFRRTAGPLDLLLIQNCLMASFEDRSVLNKRDLDLIRDLGLRFRGRSAWPLFRSYRPGYEPWYLTDAEARFLATALRQALDVSERFASDRRLLPRARPQGRYLVRVPERTAAGIAWNDALLTPASAAGSTARPAPPIDEDTAARLASLPAGRSVIQVAYWTLPAPVKEAADDRPWFPQMALVAQAGSGLLLDNAISRAEDMPEELVEATLKAISLTKERPARIEVQQPEVMAWLEPTARRLGVRVTTARRLAAVEAARRELDGFLGRGEW